MILPFPRCAAVLLLTAAFLRAQEPEDVNALLEPIRAKHDLPALAAAAVIDGRLVAVGVTGVRALGHREAVTREDRWHLGSCTKSITASLAGILVDEGKIHWDTTIAAALPQVASGMNADYKNVTLEQLLTNRAGVPGDPPPDLWSAAWAMKGTPRQQRLAFVTGLVRRPPAAPSGTKYIYSNQGFAIAGAMLEHAAQTPYEELVQKRLFAPLGLKSGGFGAPGSPGRIDEPRGHDLKNGKLEPIEPGPAADNPPAIAPAARAHLSIADFARYAAWHADAKTLLKPATFEKLHTAPPGADGEQPYAMGWIVAETDWSAGARPSLHVGSNTHSLAVVWIAPARKSVLRRCDQFRRSPQRGGRRGDLGVDREVPEISAASAQRGGRTDGLVGRRSAVCESISPAVHPHPAILSMPFYAGPLRG